MLAAGIMSGTSLDGIDVAICEIEGLDQKTQVKLLAFDTIAFEPQTLANLSQALNRDQVSLADISRLNVELGQVFGQAVLRVCQQNDLDSKNLAFIASHGQTLYHDTSNQNNIRHTLQLGEASEIVALCQCPVISDFRPMDVALGGAGAPLVPYAEWVLYQDPSRTQALQNIGGIGNVTILPKSGRLSDLVAFDTGPGNMVINEAMQILFNQTYDKDGNRASQGQVQEKLAQHLMAHPYLQAPLPKSTGRELFGRAFTQELIDAFPQISPLDFIATVTWYSAACIAFHLDGHIPAVPQVDRLIVSGGGAYNPQLIRYLKELMPKVEVIRQEDLGYSSEAKEAIAFVILGNQTFHGRPSNVPSVTGASQPAILGKITPWLDLSKTKKFS